MQTISDMETDKPGIWYRDGNLVYKLEETETATGKLRLQNAITIKVEASSKGVEERLASILKDLLEIGQSGNF